MPKILPHDVPPRRWCRDTQLVEQLVEVPTPVSYSSLLQRTMEQHVVAQVAEQVIDLPKIILENIPSRRLCRDTQLAEQLVEVPTIVSYSFLQRTMEQHVDIPVPVGGGRNAGLQGFLAEQSSTTAMGM